MDRTAPTDHPISPILANRYSPYVFDSDRDVARADLTALFEAARWTMSCYNAQPWRYVVGVRSRDRATWEKVLDVLVEGNQAWARHAPVLALGLTELHFEHNGKPNPAARHDLGGASACLTMEASTRGIYVHQMLGIQPEKARAVFDLPDEIEAVTGIAIGYRGDSTAAEPKLAERDGRPRERKPLADVIIRGRL